MDLVTLALAKGYTDKRIEKAELGEIELDKTLTKEGSAADAKAVGEAISKMEGTPGPQGPQGPQGLPGQDGKDGTSGVYVGSGEIPAGYNVQIDPTGETPVLVQSVNGVKPDPSGNVEIELPDSGGSEYTLPIATPDTLGGVKPIAKSDDMTQSVGVDADGGLWTKLGATTGTDGVFKTIADFTTTEATTEIHIPINTEEMAEKLRKASEYRILLYIPRDTEDSETSTSGKVNIGFYVGWNNTFVIDLEAIPAPSVSWIPYCVSSIYVFHSPNVSLGQSSPILITQARKNDGSTSKLTQGEIYTDTLTASGTHYIYVGGSQNMAPGTRFIMEVRL